MIQAWGIEHKTSQISEELLDEKIEVTFTQAKNLFSSAKQLNDINTLSKAYGNFSELASNKRLLNQSTDRHKVILFDTYYCIAEILYLQAKQPEALQFYLKAVKIRDDHRDCWYKMGEILKTLREPTYRGRLDCYLKALEVNKCEDNTTIIMRICDIYFLSSEIHKCMKVLDIILKRIPTSIDHLMMKSFLLSLNAATTDESEFLLNKACMLAKRVIDYSSIEVINQYLSSIKPPSHDLDDQTQQIKLIPPNQTIISIQKLNIRGLEKFIKDLHNILLKQCPYADKLNKSLSDNKVELIKKEIIRDLKSCSLVVEFSNAEGNSIPDYISQKLNFNIDKIYQAEYEKELKENQNATENQKQTTSNAYSRLKRRVTKRRSNISKMDMNAGWEIEFLPSQKFDEFRRIFTTDVRKYLDAMKKYIIAGKLGDLLSDEEARKAYLLENYQSLGKNNPELKDEPEENEENAEQQKENTNEEKKRGRK